MYRFKKEMESAGVLGMMKKTRKNDPEGVQRLIRKIQIENQQSNLYCGHVITIVSVSSSFKARLILGMYVHR